MRLRGADYADTADRLEDAITDYETRVSLTIAHRDTTLAALEEAPPDLAELRGVLLRELEWPRAEGL